MVQLEVHPEKMSATELEAWIKSSLAELPRDSVVKLKIHGMITEEAMQVLSAPTLRSLAPQSMNISSAAYPKYLDPSRPGHATWDPAVRL